MVYKPDHGPGSNIIIGRGDYIDISPVSFPGISRIGRFGIDRFNNIIRSIERLIPDQLDLHFSVPKLFHYKNSDVLLLVAVQCGTQNNGMYISVDIVRNGNIIYKVIAVQVQVIDHGLLIIQTLLKSFQGL